MAVKKKAEAEAVVEATPEAVTETTVIRLTAAGKAGKIREPYLDIWFKAGQVTEVPEVTNWMQCQIDAGLLVVVK